MLDARVIQREINLSAPLGSVWKALTDPEQITNWFGTDVEIDPREGGKILFHWGDEFQYPGVIEEIDPPHKLVFRWRSFRGDLKNLIDTEPNTLVIFTLKDVARGTRLTLTETGFDALPADLRDEVFEENGKGWDKKLRDLEDYINTLAEAADWSS